MYHDMYPACAWVCIITFEVQGIGTLSGQEIVEIILCFLFQYSLLPDIFYTSNENNATS